MPRHVWVNPVVCNRFVETDPYPGLFRVRSCGSYIGCYYVLVQWVAGSASLQGLLVERGGRGILQRTDVHCNLKGLTSLCHLPHFQLARMC